MKKSISIFLAVTLILGSFSVFSFATGEVEKPAKPTNLKSYSAYKSIALEWSPVEGATGYNIYRNGKPWATIGTSERAYDNNNMMAYIDKKDVSDGYAQKEYKYYVTAVKNNVESEPSETVADACVRPMYINITFKETKKLKSHDGKKKSYKFKRGTTVHTYFYVRGYYYFYHTIGGKQYYFRVYYPRVGNFKAKYTKSFNYSPKEAEYFVYTSNQTSLTNRLLWVNLYTQHMYVFTGKKGAKGKGAWRINKTKYSGKVQSDWEISSGKPVNPTPMGINVKYKGKLTNIYKKAAFSHGNRRLWNFFHHESAIHGPVSNTYGKPLSGGCVRNPWPRAKFIFKKIPKKTRVVTY